MPLPGLIDGIEPEAQSRVPPFCDGNGNLYRVTEEYLAGGNNPQMNKSTDGGQTWAIVDAAGAPTGSSFNDVEAAWVDQYGTTLILAFTDDTSFFYCTFNTSDAATNPDTWQVKEIAFAFGTTSGSRGHVSFVVRSDGSVLAYHLEGGTNHQTFYSVKTNALVAGGWSATSLFQPTSSSYLGVMPVLGASDTAHMFFHDYANRWVRYRTQALGAGPSSSVRADSTGTSTASGNYHAVGNTVRYVSGADDVVAALYASSSGLRLVSVVNGTVQAEQLVDSNAPQINPSNSEGSTSNDGPQIHLAVDGTTLHAMWVEAATGDVYYSSRPHGGAWTARVQKVATSSTGLILWLYCNVYTRGGSRILGYTADYGPHVDDDGNIYYDEIVLSTPSANLDRLRIGADIPTSIRIGADTVSKVYVGSTQVWP